MSATWCGWIQDTRQMTFHSNLQRGGLDHSTVVQVKGAQTTLDLSSTFGKAHRQVNISRLKFFESRDSKLGPANVCPQPLWGHDGVPHYEIKRICNARCHKGVGKLWVEWQGYDQSQNGWMTRSSLLQDVPHFIHAFEANPSVFKSPKRAPKRACTAVRDIVLPPPPPALPVAPRHPRQVRSSVVVGKPNSVGVSCFRQLPPPPPALPAANHQPCHIRRAVIGLSQIGAGVVVSRQSTLRSGFFRGGS